MPVIRHSKGDVTFLPYYEIILLPHKNTPKYICNVIISHRQNKINLKKIGMKTKLRIFLYIVLPFLFIGSLNAANWYVKPNATGTGASWDDPCNISVIAGTPAGIADGDVVYMAAGTYESSTSKSIVNYISIFGGYPANLTGTNLPTRDLVADSTVLVPSAGGTARCLVINATTAPGVNKIVLDGLHFRGFTMTTGNSGTALSITTSQGAIDIKNCSFKNNVSLNANGGAVYMGSFAYNITISFDKCNFFANQSTWTSANGYGGAIYFNNGTTAKTINITNCNFKNNKSYSRAAALYFTQSMSCSISDCIFDSNQCTTTTDATSNGGCVYVAGGGTAAVNISVQKSIFLNSYITGTGSVFWFNTTPKNTLTLTNCSLIGNYSSRTTSTRAAVDVSSFATTLDAVITNSVLSNYNWSGGAKASNKADVMNLGSTSASTSSTFTNSILNGVYFSTGNTYDAVTPTLLYQSTGYLNDATIALALSGDLKITDKIVFNKIFTSGDVGTFTPTQIFDLKLKLNLPMTLIATIPTGYKLTVDGVDYSAGTNVQISIPKSLSDPAVSLSVDTSTGTVQHQDSDIKYSSNNGILKVCGVNAGDIIRIYNMNGQLQNQKTATSSTEQIAATGIVIIKINTFISKTLIK